VTGRVAYRLINEDTVGKGNVTTALVEHFNKRNKFPQNLIFATHALLPLIPFLMNKRRWHLIVDEEIQAVQYASHQLPIAHTNDIQLEPYNAIYSRIVADKTLKAIGRNKDNDDCIKVIAQTVRRLTNPHWFNCVNTEQHERLRRGEIRTLAFHSILAPSIVDGFASVFMTAANFEAPCSNSYGKAGRPSTPKSRLLRSRHSSEMKGLSIRCGFNHIKMVTSFGFIMGWMQLTPRRGLTMAVLKLITATIESG
jgi:hypothetical protein